MDTKRLSAAILGVLMVGGSAAGVLAVNRGDDAPAEPVVTEYVVEVPATSPQVGSRPDRSLVASGVDSRDSSDSHDFEEEHEDDRYEGDDREGDDDDDD
jgi:hypothetical protein